MIRVASGKLDTSTASAAAAWGVFRRWCGVVLARRRQRIELAALEDHLLKDIGVSRDEAAREAAKPWWR
jgi:uncharacterized protein YjiS (DUF1127 family)